MSRACVIALSLFVLDGAGWCEARPAAQISAQDLATLRDLDGLRVSPDGDWAAFQIRQADPDRNRYLLDWYVIETKEGAPALHLAGAGEPLQPVLNGQTQGLINAPSPQWSADGQSLHYLRRDAHDHNDGVQIWRSRRDGATEQLTHVDGNVRDFLLSADGRRILFTVEATKAQLDAALAQEWRTGFFYDDRTYPFHSPIPLRPANSPFVSGFVTGVQISDQPLWVLDLSGGRERSASDTEAAEYRKLAEASQVYGRISVASLAGTTAWTEARDPERQGGMAPLTIVAKGAGEKEAKVCLAQQCSGQKFTGLWWRGDRELIFARSEGRFLESTALYSWTIGAASVRRILRTAGRFGEKESSDEGCAIAQGRLICFYEQPDVSRRLVAVELDTGAIQVLFDPNSRFSDFDLGPEPRHLEFQSTSGAAAHGYLVLPPGRRAGVRLPLVVVTYSCSGFLRGGVGDEYPIYPLAAQGFAVLCFDIPTNDHERLSVMDWQSYENWSRGPGDPIKHRIQDALDAAVDQLSTAGIIDPQRVGVTGLSYGGEVVMYALFKMRHLSTAIASGPEIGPSATYLYGPDGGAGLSEWGLGSASSDRWRALSVVHNTSRVTAPLLLNVTDHEMLGSLEAFSALRNAGRAVEMHVFPGEYHVKSQPAHRLVVYRRNIDWMNFWLRGVESGLTGDASQYVRWRAMRAMKVNIQQK